jgi:hypothetical protein
MIRLLVNGIFTVIFFPTRIYFRQDDRKYIEAEAARQEAMIDRHVSALEGMGFFERDAEHIVYLKHNEFRHGGLTHAEKRELAEIYTRRSAKYPHRRAAE